MKRIGVECEGRKVKIKINLVSDVKVYLSTVYLCKAVKRQRRGMKRYRGRVQMKRGRVKRQKGGGEESEKEVTYF